MQHGSGGSRGARRAIAPSDISYILILKINDYYWLKVLLLCNPVNNHYETASDIAIVMPDLLFDSIHTHQEITLHSFRNKFILIVGFSYTTHDHNLQWQLIYELSRVCCE